MLLDTKHPEMMGEEFSSIMTYLTQTYVIPTALRCIVEYYNRGRNRGWKWRDYDVGTPGKRTGKGEEGNQGRELEN